MKAITLLRPSSSLVVLGEKRIEARSWPTSHRGHLAIHSSGRLSAACRDLCDHPLFRAALARSA
jgi:hypothetical protein